MYANILILHTRKLRHSQAKHPVLFSQQKVAQTLGPYDSTPLALFIFNLCSLPLHPAKLTVDFNVLI